MKGGGGGGAPRSTNLPGIAVEVVPTGRDDDAVAVGQYSEITGGAGYCAYGNVCAMRAVSSGSTAPVRPTDSRPPPNGEIPVYGFAPCVNGFTPCANPAGAQAPVECDRPGVNCWKNGLAVIGVCPTGLCCPNGIAPNSCCCGTPCGIIPPI